MRLCALCRKEIRPDKYFSRKSVCSSCGGDLHICLNCRLYSETKHNKCAEPKAEFQRTRDKANYCDWFAFKESPSFGKNIATGKPEAKEDAKKAFEDIFKK